MSETARLIDTIKWKSIDKDNMEFEARVTCYQRDAILSQTERVKALEEALRDHMAADEAMLDFIVKVDPKKVGEDEWGRQHAILCKRRLASRNAARAALQGTGT